MINETVSVDAGPAIGALDELAAAAARADEAMAKLKVPSFSAGGAGRMAASLDAAAAKVEAAIGKMEASFGKLKAVGAEAGAAMGNIGKAGAESAAGLGDAAKAANDAAVGYGRLGKAANESQAAMDRQAVATARAGEASVVAGRKAQAHGHAMRNLILGGGVAVAYSIDKAMKLQSEVTRLYSAAGLKGVSQAAATKAALSIGSKTGFTGTTIAEAMYHPVSAGLDWKTSKLLTEQAANLANVHGANLEDTTYALSSVMKAYNEGAKKVIPTAALLNSIVGQGDMRFQDFNQSVKNFAPTGASMGISLQSMGAGLAYLTDRGNSAETASTRLTMGLSMATAGSKAANTYMKDLGLTTGDLNLKNKSLQATMEKGGLTTNKFAADLKKPDGLYVALKDMQGAFHKAGLSASQADTVMAKIFGGGRSDKAIVSLMQNLEGVRQKYVDIGKGVKDYGKSVAAEQATAQQKWKDLLASGQNLAAGLGVHMLPAFTKVTGGLANLMQGPGGGITAGVLGGAAALAAGKKLFSGIESSLQTVGKVGQFLKIPGLDKLATLGKTSGAGMMAEAAAGNQRAASMMVEASAGMQRAAGVMGEDAAVMSRGGKLGGPGAATSKLGSALGAATMVTAGAWLIGHLSGMLIPKGTKADEAAYRKNIPGWLQAPTDFVFGSKAPSLYAHLPSGADLWHDLFGGGTPPHRPAPPLPRFANGQPFYGEVPVGLKHPPNFRAEVPVGVAAPIPTYPGGRPFYGEVPHRAAAPFYGEVPRGVAPAFTAPAVQSRGPTLQGIAAHMPVIKPKIQPPDTGAIKGALASIANSVKLKPVKFPPPDVSALTAAKGKAQAAGAGITQAIESALHKPVKAAPPDISPYRAAIGPARADGANISAGLAAGILAGEGAVVAAASQVAAAAAAAMAHAVQSHSPSKKTMKTGKDMTAGLVIGLQGGQAAVDAAATALGKSAAKAADIAAIDAASKKLLGQVPAGDTALTRMLKADTKDLERMANTRAKLEQEISDSEQVAKSIVSGASVMNALNAVNPAGNEPIASSAIITGQGYQASSLKQFAASLKQLQKMGLNATELSQIAQAGPDQGLGIAQGIASGGKDAVKQINSIQKQIQASSAQIGNIAGPAMYEAGKDVAKGLAAGLKSELNSLDKAMEHLAKSMTQAVEKHLKTTKAAAKKAGAGTASAAASGASDAVASASAGGSGSLGAAAAGLSHAGASLSAAAAALTGAAAALKGDASHGPGGTVKHPVAAGGTGRIAPGAPAYGGGHYGTPVYLPPAAGQHVHYHTHVTQNVQGNVHAMTDLVDEVQNAFLVKGTNNWQTGIIPHGRAG